MVMVFRIGIGKVAKASFDWPIMFPLSFLNANSKSQDAVKMS
jgi:hypothetical protein